MAPVPCAHCGTLFMKHSLRIDSEKICNSCKIKDQIRNPPKGEPKMEKMKILIECTPAQHAKIEEHCMNVGKSFSEYFLELHEGYVDSKFEENAERIETDSSAIEHAKDKHSYKKRK